MTKQFKKITASMMPFPVENIDTDQIIPARFLKVTDKNGLGTKLFHDWRYNEDGSDNPEFVINKAQYQNAKILLAGDNFGCGSSREHAPWAIVGWGFEALISTSFADIFRNNALKNGLLPVIVSEEGHRKLLAAVEKDPNTEVSIDLESQSVVFPDGSSETFPVDAFAKHCLLNGIDSLGYLQNFENQISEFEAKRPSFASQ